jgi:hypothetical protein
MRQHRPEVPHVNARPAYRAIAEMIGLGLSKPSASMPVWRGIMGQSSSAIRLSSRSGATSKLH